MKRRILVELEVDTDDEFYDRDDDAGKQKECPECCPFYPNSSCRNMAGCVRYDMATAKLVNFKEI